MHVSPYLNVVVVSDVFVSRGDAGLDRLCPCLSQFLRLSLQHAAPADASTLHVHTAAGCERGCLTAHWRILGRPPLTSWGTPPQNRTSSHYLHMVWQNTVSDPPPPQSVNPTVAQRRVNIDQLWRHSCDLPSKTTCVMVNQKYNCQWFNETAPWASFGRPAGYFVLKTIAFKRKWNTTLHITLYLTDSRIVVFIFPIYYFPLFLVL